MLVAFWSNIHGQAGVTTNMSVISLACALGKNKSIFAIHSQISDKSLEKTLMPNLSEFTSGTISNYGFDPMMRYARSGLLNTDNFSDYSVSLIKDRTYDLVIGTKQGDLSDLDRASYDEVMLKILEMSKQKYDLSFVDLAGANYNSLTSRIIDIADLLVVNISQSHEAINALKSVDFLNGIDKKIMYLIGRYEDGIKSNRSNITRKYKLDKVLVIPYLAQLIDVINRGEMVEFIARRLMDKNNSKIPFFAELNKTCDAIISRMEA